LGSSIFTLQGKVLWARGRERKPTEDAEKSKDELRPALLEDHASGARRGAAVKPLVLCTRRHAVLISVTTNLGPRFNAIVLVRAPNEERNSKPTIRKQN
jgi:hypothetical protein